MYWALLAGIGACTNAGYYIVNKKFLRTIDPDILAASGFLCSAALLLGISVGNGIPPLGPLFFPAVCITAAINILATLLTFRALSSTDISLAIPMISFTPIFLVGTAALILHEAPSALGIAGIVTIVAGSYVLNTAAEHTRITDPFRAMIGHPGVLAMLVVAFLYAVAINFDKMGVQNSDPVFGAGITMLLIGLAFVPIALYRRARNRQKISQVTAGNPAARSVLLVPFRLKEAALAGILIAILITLEAITINTAYTEQIAPYVITIKRMSIILIVLYGTLVFHETGLVRRLSGAGIMVLGVILILLFP
ncbi:EamA family transporter [Methanoregula sp.]|uniref:EamA family transporter n=1 Tax=Methanoregula sp. TaxID=2052170 RepID=UPI003564668C